MKQDPRITAYATGELEGREREAFEVELAASDRLHREVESMSGLAKQLASSAKPTDCFTADERARLLAKCAATRRSRAVAKNSFKVVLWTTVGIAACLIIFAGLVGIIGQNSGPFLDANRMPVEPSTEGLLARQHLMLRHHKLQASPPSAPTQSSGRSKFPQARLLSRQRPKLRSLCQK